MRKLGDTVIEIIAGGDIDKNKVVEFGKYPIYANSHSGDGIVGYYDDFYRVNGPAVTVTGRGEVGFAKARETDFTPVVRLLAIRSKHNHYFLENAINLHGVTVESTGVPQLTVPQLSAYRIYFPFDIQEENQIGTFFSTLDQHITLHQRKLDKLKSVKQAYLSEMFPAEGERVPKRRFPGFTDDWELRRFSELAEIRRGLTYSPTSIRKEGVRVLRSSNIDEDTFTFGEDDVFVDKWVVKIPLVKEGDILITAANGSSRLVGKHAIIKDLPANSAIHGGFMLLASCRNPEFVNSLMSSAWYNKFINLYVAGGNGAIGNLNKNDLDEQNVLVPNPKEQSAIGTFFSTLDRHITLHQRKS
ncbi:TPA: restriction endonuclease subunit S [Streptococcus suis]